MEFLTLKQAGARAGYKSRRGFLYFAERVGLRVYRYGRRIRRVSAEELERVLTQQRLEPDATRELVRAIGRRRQRRPPERAAP